MWQQAIAVFLGAGLGGVLRWLVVAFGESAWGVHFPWGTLVVNVAGSLAIGLCAAFMLDHASSVVRAFWMVGLLGGFTTFSAFSLQAVDMLLSGRVSAALLYSFASLVLCISAAIIGLDIGQRFFASGG